MVRNRHSSGVASRGTHGISSLGLPADFRPSVLSSPRTPFESSQSDREPTNVTTTGARSVTSAAVVDGAIGTIQIADNSFELSKFTQDIRPVPIVGVLPTLPNASYPLLSYVVLSTTERLYKNVGNVWVLGITGADIVADSITAGQIAAGGISASEIAAGAITADKIGVGAMRANLLVGGDFEDPTNPVSGAYVNNGVNVAGAFPSWRHSVAAVESAPSSSSSTKSGIWVVVLRNPTGWVANTGMFQIIPVRSGRRYRLSGWAWKSGGSGGLAQIIAHAYDKVHVNVAFNVMLPVSTTSATITFGEAFYTVPAGVAYLYVYCRWATPAAVNEVFAFEDVTLEEVPGGMLNGPGSVVIDDTGVTIVDGALNVTSALGQTTISDGAIAANAVTVLGRASKGANLLDNSSFEIAPQTVGFGALFTASTQVQPYWLNGTVGCASYNVHANARTGDKILRVAGNGVAGFPGLTSYNIPVQPGHTYRLSAWMVRPGGVQTGITRIDTYGPTGALVTSAAVSLTHATSTLTFKETTYTVPTNGTVSSVRVLNFINAALPASTDIHYWEDVSLVEASGALKNGSATVVIDGNGVAITNGELTVTNAGAVVIIDGTSNIFKIAATGTLTRAFPAVATSISTTVTLSALGSGYTTPPALLAMTTDDNSSSSQVRRNTMDAQINLTTGVVEYQAESGVYLTAGTPVVALRASSNTVAPGTTAATRYYVLVEAGI